jgi:hypothetical protein
MTEHYVEKSGYWVYDVTLKTLTHSERYPYNNWTTGRLIDWIYVDGPGKVKIKNDKILDFTPQHKGFDNLDQDELKCWTHRPKEYVGFTEKYFYCTVCGTKL